jgi:hypothetical protein
MRAIADFSTPAAAFSKGYTPRSSGLRGKNHSKSKVIWLNLVRSQTNAARHVPRDNQRFGRCSRRDTGRCAAGISGRPYIGNEAIMSYSLPSLNICTVFPEQSPNQLSAMDGTRSGLKPSASVRGESLTDACPIKAQARWQAGSARLRSEPVASAPAGGCREVGKGFGER